MNFNTQSADFWVKLANVLVLTTLSLFFKRVLYPAYSEYLAFHLLCAFCSLYCIITVIQRYRALSKKSL